MNEVKVSHKNKDFYEKKIVGSKVFLVTPKLEITLSKRMTKELHFQSHGVLLRPLKESMVTNALSS
jgi:hypothetical protein